MDIIRLKGHSRQSRKFFFSLFLFCVCVWYRLTNSHISTTPLSSIVYYLPGVSWCVNETKEKRTRSLLVMPRRTIGSWGEWLDVPTSPYYAYDISRAVCQPHSLLVRFLVLLLLLASATRRCEMMIEQIVCLTTRRRSSSSTNKWLREPIDEGNKKSFLFIFFTFKIEKKTHKTVWLFVWFDILFFWLWRNEWRTLTSRFSK